MGITSRLFIICTGKKINFSPQTKKKTNRWLFDKVPTLYIINFFLHRRSNRLITSNKASDKIKEKNWNVRLKSALKHRKISFFFKMVHDLEIDI